MVLDLSKPYSESCDQNKDPIFSVIRPLLKDAKNVLEVGSGTGQHAVYFAEKIPSLVWHTSDCEPYLPGITMWLAEAGLDNTRMPIELNVSHSIWPSLSFDAIFTANTVHIMHWHNVEALFAGVGKLLNTEGQFIVYGPFNYKNAYTSDSNERFDGWLKSRDTESGIKNFEDLCLLAEKDDMFLVDDIEMPANNRILVWKRLKR